MVNVCCVRNCRNTSLNSLCHFHRFPKNNVRHCWEIFCGRDISHIKVPLICSHHFTPQDYNLTIEGMVSNTLKRNTVPSIKVNSSEVIADVEESEIELHAIRYEEATEVDLPETEFHASRCEELTEVDSPEFGLSNNFENNQSRNQVNLQ